MTQGFKSGLCYNKIMMKKNLIIDELLKTLKQANFKLSGIKLERVRTILEKYISEKYNILDLNVYRKANLANRCQDDRHIKFNIKKDDEEEKCIEISIEEV